MPNDQLPMTKAYSEAWISLGFGHWRGAPVAQSDRAAGFEPAGREFNPLRARQTRMTNDQLPMTNALSETRISLGFGH